LIDDADRVAALLGDVRRLAGDTADPRGADAQLLDLVPVARREGTDLVRDGDALASLAATLTAPADPDLGPDLATVVVAARDGALAERAIGSRLEAVDRIDDLVLAADALAVGPQAAASQRAVVVQWAVATCGPGGSG
jgi:hypothetical protein